MSLITGQERAINQPGISGFIWDLTGVFHRSQHQTLFEGLPAIHGSIGTLVTWPKVTLVLCGPIEEIAKFLDHSKNC